MSTDLGFVLRDLASQQRRSADLRAREPHAEINDLARRVRLRRASRMSLVGAVTVAVLALGAATVYGLTGQEPTPPAISDPTPTQTPTPTPSPTPSEPEADPVTIHPLLPAAHPLPEGAFEATTAGWSIAAYHVPRDSGDADGTGDDYLTVVYLISPEGDRFELPSPGSLESMYDWLPGTSLALATLSSGEVAVVDLLAGEVVSRLAIPDGSWLAQGRLVAGGGGSVVAQIQHYDALGRFRSATMLFSADGGIAVEQVGSIIPIWTVDGTREHVLDNPDADFRYRVVMAETLTEVTMPPIPAGLWYCSARGWLGADAMFSCTGPGAIDSNGVDTGAAGLWRFPLDGGDPSRVIDGAAFGGYADSHQAAWQLGGRIVIQLDDLSFLELADGAVVPLPASGLFVLGSAGERLIGTLSEGDGSVVLFDPFTGASTPLAPATQQGWVSLVVG